VELILIDATAVEGPMKWLDLLTNLRADARTADIPTLITGTLKDGDLLRPRFERFARTDYVVTPTDPNLFGRQLNKILERMGARPMSDDERAAYAQEAATLLGRIASRPRGPFAAGLQSIEPALAVALANPASNTAAAAALGDVPGADAQRDLAGLVIDSSQPVASRVAAGQQLVRSIQRFGPLLSNTQEKALVEAAAGNTEPQLRSIMAAVIGALRPAPEVSGQRLQGNSTKPAGAAPTNEH
jgi:hypothetical protein